ncbi:hypothetical protein ABPG74_021148 [Tetrahymena malaccensis]
MRNMQQTQQNNQKDSQIKLILNSLQLKQFYINHLTKLIRPFELRKHISILVVIINSLTLLSFIFKNENRNSIQNHEVGSQNRADGVFKFIKQFQLTPFIGNALNSNQIQLDVVPFILNSLFILALALAYAFREYDLTKYCGKYFQIYTTFYNKWPFYVFLNISLHLIKESSQKKSIAIVAISYLNVIFTLIIGYFLELQDFSYSFEESRNYLAKQQSKQRFFLLFLRTFLVFMYQFRDQELLAIYSFFYFFIEVLFLLFDDYYLSKDLNQVYFYLCASSLQISFCLLTNIYIFKSTDTILACIITVPLSIQSIRYYQQRQYQNLFLEFSNQSHLFSQLSESKFLKIIRILIDQAKQSQNSYLQRGQGIYYQTIIQTHESQCNQMDQSCFCNIYRRFKNSLEIEEFSEQHNRQEYAHKVILQFLEAQIQNSNSGVKEISNKLYFSHLTYLYEVINNPTKVLVNIQKMSIKYFCERNNVSLIDLFYFQQLKLQILQDYKIHLFDSNIENQKLNMMEVILFDDKINICKDKLRMILFEIGHFYDFLSGNFINLFQIQKLSLPLINLNEELEQKLIELFQIHPQDIDLQYLTSIYIQLIDFQNRRVKEFQKAAVDLSLHKSGKYQRINEISQNSEKQCVIFASLIENEFLVKKTSNLFEKIFGYSQDFIYGKQLNILIPNMLKRHHNQMIQSFIDEQSMEIINQGERHLFGLDKKGFIFPMSLRIKLQVFENDLGVCALVQKKKQPFSYIFFQNDGTITDLSKKIYFDIFKNLGFKNGQQLNIFEMIPSFKEVFKNQQLNKYFSSILVVKEPIQVSQSKQINNEKLLLSPNNNYNLHYQGHEVFQIEYRFLQHSTKNKLDINYLEIDFYQKETNIIKRNFIIDQVSKQKSRKDSQSFVKADSQQNSDLLNSFQHQYVSTREFSQVFENLDYNSIRNKDDLKSAQLSFQKWQTIEKSKHNQVEFTPNQYETYKLQQQNNILTQSKQCQDLQINLKMSENQSPNNYPKSLESKYSNQNGLYDINNNNQDFQIQTLFSPNKMTTQQFEQVETILSPTAAFNQEKQLILANQSCEYQNFVLLHKPISINCNNLQEISLNYTTSQQQLNYQQSRNFIRQNQFNNLKQISYLDNLCLEEQNYSQDFPQPNKEPRSINFIDKDDIKQEQKNEIASVNSSNYSTEELMKRKMIKRIKQKGFTKGLNLMAFTGIAAFFILGAVSLIIYIDNIISLNSFINSFLKIDDAQYCFIDIMSIVALNIYQGFLGESQSFIIDSIDLQNQEIIQTGYQQYAVLQDYNSNLQKLVLGNESGEQLYELQNKLFQVQIYASGFYNNAEVKKNSTTTFEQSLQYTLMQYFYEITFYILHYEDQQEDFIWGNIFNFKERMKDLQLVVENYAKEQFNNMNLQQIYAIILFSIISAVLVFSVLPLNVYIQVQKEKILKLFGTFSPSTIEFQIKQIELGIQKVDQMKSLDQTCNNSLHSNKQSSNKKKKEQLRNLNFYSDLQSPEDQKYAYKLENQAPRYIQRQQDKRNRQIASFSNIPKFSFYLFFLGVITTAVLLVMPVLNIVQFTPFETESKATLLDRISLIDVFSLIIENQSPNMEQVYLMWAGYSPQTSYYFGYLQKLQIQNQSVFKQLQSLTFDLGVKRFNQGLFEDFYQNLLNQNACQVRQNYPSYFNTNVTEQQCNKIFNGILQRGLIFSIQKIFQTFEEVFNIYQIQDLNELIDEFVELQNSFSFIEFKLLIQIVSEIVNGIRAVLIYLYQFQDHEIVIIYSFCYFSVEVTFLLLDDFYLSTSINLIYFYLCAASLQISFCFLIEMYVFKGYDIILACMVTVPLSIQVITNYKQMQNLSLLLEFSNRNDLLQQEESKFLKIIRILLEQARLSQNSYFLKGQGINYEIISHFNQNKCSKNLKYCFCHKFKKPENKDSLQIQELPEQHFRQEYVQLVILQLLEDYIEIIQINQQSQRSSLNLKLSYLNYIYEIINNPTQVLVQLQKISVKYANKMNLFDQFYFEQVKLQILKDYQIKLFDSNIENQKLKMMEIILFDSKINIYKEKLSSILFQIGHFYDFLNGNSISLQQLEKISLPLINLNENLEQNIVELFQINPTNFDLQYLTSIYIQLIDFQNRSIKEFQNAAFNLSKQKSQNQSKLAEINQFSENSCVIYTSLIEKEFLIKNVSNQFDKIFGYTSEFIQGKQINILIPNLIKSQHNQMIQMFIDQSSMDIVCQGDRILFGLDQNGFIFHISLRMKIQASENDLGVCALVQKKKQIYSYIFFENEGTITDFSKKIFQDIYSSHGLNRQQQLNIFELIPSLQEMMKNLQFNMVFSSVLVIKEQYLNISSNNENYSQSLKQINNLYTENDEVFLIQFKLFSHKTKNNIDTNYIEIYFCQKELNQFKKSILIDQLNKQKIQRQSLMYQKQESLQTLDFTNSQQQQLFSTRDFSNVFQNSDQNTNKEDTKNQQNNYLKLQKKSGDVEQALNQNEFNQFQFLSNDKLHFKKYKDQIIIKNDENTNIHQRSYEQQQVYQNGNYDQQDQGFQVSMINSPNKMLTNTVENTEIILSPLCSQRQNQLFLINQSNECQNFNQLKENQKFQPEQNQQNSNNLQEISLQNISLYQYLNKQHSQNKIQVHYQNNLKQNSLIKNNYYEEKYASQDLTPAIRRKSQSLNFKEQEDFMQDQKNEIASANSSKQRTEQMMKRKMIKTIKKENCYNGIFLMVFTGILAFIILSIVSLVIYYENLNHLDSFVQSFLKIDNAIYCFIDIMKLIALKNYQSIIGGGYSFIIENSDLKRQEFQQTGYQQQITLNDYSVNFQNLILDNDSTNQLSYLQNKLFQVQTYSEGFYLHAQDEKNTTNTFQKSLQFTLMQYYYEITQYYLKTEEQQEDFIWGNIFNFKQRMKDLQLIVESYAKDQLDQMSLHQISELILFISISTLIVFSVLPLYAIIQIQKEKVLKLFGTFQPSTIEFQIKQIELGLLKIEQINILEQTNNSRYTNARSITQKKYVKQTRDNFQFKQQENEQKYENKCNLQIPLFIQRQKDKRNRQIASFSNIPKFNFILFFLGIIVVALLLLIPIINKTLFNPFETESKAILQDIISLLDVFSLIIENQAPQIEQTLVIGIGTPPQNSKYNNYLQQLQDENKQVFQYLQNLTTNLGVQRKNQGLFSDFYQNLLNQNVCQVRQNYPQYFNSNITESRCNKLFNGILQKGLIISIQQVFQTLQEIYQIYQIEDINELTLQFIKLQSSYSFIECQQLIQVISEVVNAIRQYQNEELQQYENILKHNLLYLFISQQRNQSFILDSKVLQKQENIQSVYQNYVLLQDYKQYQYIELVLGNKRGEQLYKLQNKQQYIIYSLIYESGSHQNGKKHFNNMNLQYIDAILLFSIIGAILVFQYYLQIYTFKCKKKGKFQSFLVFF